MSGYLSDKLQKLQNRAARAITKSPFHTSSSLLLAMLTWEKLSIRHKKQKALIIYKTLNDLAADCLQCFFTQRHIKDCNLKKLEQETDTSFRSDQMCGQVLRRKKTCNQLLENLKAEQNVRKRSGNQG